MLDCETKATLEMNDSQPTTRKTLYWFLAGIATIFYLLICSVLMIVPGVEPATKLVVISLAALLLAVPVLIGFWNFTETDAPIMVRPLGPVVGVVLMLQFLLALVQLAVQLRAVLSGRLS